MKFKALMLGLSVSFFALNGLAYNEPYAGAIVKKETNYTPKADFNPSDITDIMPSVGKKIKMIKRYFLQLMRWKQMKKNL
jgi:hypothetical protein